jgi:hypothetical protein
MRIDEMLKVESMHEELMREINRLEAENIRLRVVLRDIVYQCQVVLVPDGLTPEREEER